MCLKMPRAYQRKDSSEFLKSIPAYLDTIQTNELKLRSDVRKDQYEFDYRTQLNNLALEKERINTLMEATYQAKLQDLDEKKNRQDQARRYRWLDNIPELRDVRAKLIMYSFDDPMSPFRAFASEDDYDEGIYMVIGGAECVEGGKTLKWLRFYTTMLEVEPIRSKWDRKEFALGVVVVQKYEDPARMAFSTQPVKLDSEVIGKPGDVVDDIGALMRGDLVVLKKLAKQYAQICKELTTNGETTLMLTYTVFANGANLSGLRDAHSRHFVLAPSSTTAAEFGIVIYETITYENNTGFPIYVTELSGDDLDVQPTLTQRPMHRGAVSKILST
ncbi:hypothetical protein SPFM12_00215 [Salmonella phage SPFM12]|nr:hypothetical protein SPFM12_00215 [Salmonella phage SPFM12]